MARILNGRTALTPRRVHVQPPAILQKLLRLRRHPLQRGALAPAHRLHLRPQILRDLHRVESRAAQEDRRGRPCERLSAAPLRITGALGASSEKASPFPSKIRQQSADGGFQRLQPLLDDVPEPRVVDGGVFVAQEFAQRPDALPGNRLGHSARRRFSRLRGSAVHHGRLPPGRRRPELFSDATCLRRKGLARFKQRQFGSASYEGSIAGERALFNSFSRQLLVRFSAQPDVRMTGPRELIRRRTRIVNETGWCCSTGLNCRPLPYQGSALPLSYGSCLAALLRAPARARTSAIGFLQAQGFGPRRPYHGSVW